MQLTQVVVEDAGGDDEDGHELQREADVQVAVEVAVDQADQVADHEEPGNEQREVQQPLADLELQLLRILGDVPVQAPHHPHEDRDRDQEHGDREPHRHDGV